MAGRVKCDDGPMLAHISELLLELSQQGEKAEQLEQEQLEQKEEEEEEEEEEGGEVEGEEEDRDSSRTQEIMDMS